VLDLGELRNRKASNDRSVRTALRDRVQVAQPQPTDLAEPGPGPVREREHVVRPTILPLSGRRTRERSDRRARRAGLRSLRSAREHPASRRPGGQQRNNSRSRAPGPRRPNGGCRPRQAPRSRPTEHRVPTNSVRLQRIARVLLPGCYPNLWRASRSRSASTHSVGTRGGSAARALYRYRLRPPRRRRLPRIRILNTIRIAPADLATFIATRRVSLR
jgi:hypothetical protein